MAGDRERWNARYSGGFVPSLEPHPLVVRAVELGLPAGPVADLACGPSGSALYLAASGRRVLAVDISDAALAIVRAQARRRGLNGLIAPVQADLSTWRTGTEAIFALVSCTGFWDAGVFRTAAAIVAPAGLIAWEGFTQQARRDRPGLPSSWCLRGGEPASLLPADFTVIDERDVTGYRRRLLARRTPAGEG